MSMRSYFRTHKLIAAMGIVVFVLVVAAAIVIAVLNSNLLRPTIVHLISGKTGRETAIAGDLHTKLLSWTPTVEINAISIKNPPWADKPIMFSADKITVSLRLGRLLRGQIVLPRVALVKPIVSLERDKQGRASWELGSHAGTPNGNTKPAKIPTILSLTIEEGSLNVVDQIRKLRFEGSLVAAEEASKDSPAFRIRAKGSLNEKPFSLDVDGAPLKDLTPKTAYTFTAKVTAADIKLDTKVTVEKPFDLSDLNIEFVVTGKDLADGFYLTGLALPNTPPYRLAASVKVLGTTFTVNNLNGRLGSSDLSGQVVVEAKSKIPKLTARLVSKTLNIVDLAPALGASAVSKNDSLAGAQAQTRTIVDGKPAARTVTDYQKNHDRVFPDSELQVDRVRGMDADVQYRADSVNTPKVPIRLVNMHLILDKGVLTIDPLSFVLDRGTFAGTVRIDARNVAPESILDMRINNVDLSQFKSATAKSAPLTGSLMGRLQIKGTGDSLHKFAASSEGAVSVIIPHGEIGAGVAELTGIDVTRGLGLLVAKNEEKTEIRCGVIDFQAQHGNLEERRFFIDTADVLISGRGNINLQDEKIKLELKGDPKHIRFTRLRSPITVGGTLAHPSIGVDVKKLAAQGGVAAALGTLLTPVAAVIAFIDPGLAKNIDCVSALGQTTQSVPSQNVVNPK
jgi:AsmA family protein